MTADLSHLRKNIKRDAKSMSDAEFFAAEESRKVSAINAGVEGKVGFEKIPCGRGDCSMSFSFRTGSRPKPLKKWVF